MHYNVAPRKKRRFGQGSTFVGEREGGRGEEEEDEEEEDDEGDEVAGASPCTLFFSEPCTVGVKVQGLPCFSSSISLLFFFFLFVDAHSLFFIIPYNLIMAL